MPCARGINCFLSTNHGKDIITEYPHPDGMSMQLGIGQSLWRYRPSPKKPSANSEASSSPFSVRGTKTNPTVSVYVPSVPGSPFFSIQYQIDQIPPSPCKYFFFKVFIHGRQIVAWGVDTASETKGRIPHSLWRPGSLYNGIIGVEKRSLIFLPGQEKKGIADDGGLIEIQTFRASARHSRSPVLNEFRNHDNYGVATPSNGLVSSPQSMDFHSYVLIDPKDLPFATFKIHYRSEPSLRHLNIIPGPAEPSRLLTPSTPNPPTSLNSHPAPFINNPTAALPDDDVFAPNTSHPSWRESIESYHSRPLPELPTPAPKVGENKSPACTRKFSNGSDTSGMSNVPSLTASLRELLQTGELDPEKAVFGGTVIVPKRESSWVVMEPAPSVVSRGGLRRGGGEKGSLGWSLRRETTEMSGAKGGGGEAGDEKGSVVSLKREKALPAGLEGISLEPQKLVGPRKRRGLFWGKKERLESEKRDLVSSVTGDDLPWSPEPETKGPVGTRKRRAPFWERKENLASEGRDEALSVFKEENLFLGSEKQQPVGPRKRRGSFWERKEGLESEKRDEASPLSKKDLESATPVDFGEKGGLEITGTTSPVKRGIGGIVEIIWSPGKGGRRMFSGLRRKAMESGS